MEIIYATNGLQYALAEELTTILKVLSARIVMSTFLVTAAIVMSSVEETAFALGDDGPSDTANGDDYGGGIGSGYGGGNPTCTGIALPTGGKNINVITSKHCFVDYNGETTAFDCSLQSNSKNWNCAEVEVQTGSDVPIGLKEALGGAMEKDQNNTNSRDTNETGDNLSGEPLKIPGKIEHPDINIPPLI